MYQLIFPVVLFALVYSIGLLRTMLIAIAAGVIFAVWFLVIKK